MPLCASGRLRPLQVTHRSADALPNSLAVCVALRQQLVGALSRDGLGVGTVAALAQTSGAAPVGPTANVVDADASLVNPLPRTEQFAKRGHAVPPSLSETTHGPWR